jgi:hypothetical protein
LPGFRKGLRYQETVRVIRGLLSKRFGDPWP